MSEARAKMNGAIQARVVARFLDVKLPTGKFVADLTGAECARLGGWFERLARRLKPAEVVETALEVNELYEIFLGRG
jgi:hypothetical protein